MVWCASTFWAETSQGETKAEWNSQLQRRNIESPSRSRSAPLLPPRPEGHMNPDEEEAYAKECAKVRQMLVDKRERNRRLRDLGKYSLESTAGRKPSPKRKLNAKTKGNNKSNGAENGASASKDGSSTRRPVTPQAPKVRALPKRFLSPLKKDPPPAAVVGDDRARRTTSAGTTTATAIVHDSAVEVKNKKGFVVLTDQDAELLEQPKRGELVDVSPIQQQQQRRRPSERLEASSSSYAFNDDDDIDGGDDGYDDRSLSRSNSRSASPTAAAAGKRRSTSTAGSNHRNSSNSPIQASAARTAENHLAARQIKLDAMSEDERAAFLHQERLKQLLGANIVSNKNKKIVAPRAAAFTPISSHDRQRQFEHSAVQHLQRAADHRLEKIQYHREAGKEREIHTQDVVRRFESRIKNKEDSAKKAIAQKEKRFKDTIDQCETRDETNQLRTMTFLNILPHVLVIRSVRRIMIEHRMIKKLRLLLIPLIRLKIAKRLRTARVAAGLWRGRISRPTVDYMREHFTFLCEWPDRHVKALIKSMKHCAYAPGEIVAFQGEPSTSCFILTTGRVLIQQRSGERGKFHLTDLGERGSGYVHAEESLTKNVRSRHFLKLVAKESTYGWNITRRHYLKLVSVLPCANLIGREAAAVAAGNAAAAASGGGITMQPSQLMENRCFTFWDTEEIEGLLASAEQVSFDRDEVIFDIGEPAKCCYVVWKGTIKLSTPVQPPPARAGAMGLRQNRAAAAAATGGTAAAAAAAGAAGGGMSRMQSAANLTAAAAGGGAAGLNQSMALNTTHGSLNLSATAGSGGGVVAAAGGGTTGSSPTGVAGTLTSAPSFMRKPEDGSSANLLVGDSPTQPDLGVISRGTHHHLIFNPNRRHEWAIGYVNVGQVFGEDGVIFNTCRSAKAVAATECVLYKLNSTAVIEGCYTNPGEFCELKELLNQQRAQRYLLRPMSSELLAFMPQPSAAFFVRNMTPLVLSCGEALPVHNSIVFLQSGSAKISRNEGTTVFNAPCIIAAPEAFQAVLVQFNKFLESGEVTDESNFPTFGGDNNPLNASASTAHDGPGTSATTTTTTTTTSSHASSALSKIGRAVSKINADKPPATATSSSSADVGGLSKIAMAVLADVHQSQADPELLGTQVINRASCRCDMWVVKTHHLLKKFRNAAKLQDLLIASCVVAQTPPKPGATTTVKKAVTKKMSFRKKVI